MISDRELTLKTAALARAAPHQWAEFCKALQARSEAKRDQLVSSPLDGLQIAQGRAQEARDILTLFENAILAADKLERKPGVNTRGIQTATF